MKVLIKTLYKESTRIKELVFERYIKDFILISIGITMATIGLKQFLLPNDFWMGEPWVCPY
ncbi:MAG: hypothetical protein RL607_1769 [Bacteroidota bacterium]